MAEEETGSRKRSRFEDSDDGNGERNLSVQEKARLLAAKFGAQAPTNASSGAPRPRENAVAVEIRKKVYVPESENGETNFLGLLIGPGGATHRSIEEQSGAKIKFRGRGSTKDGAGEEDDDLHVLIISDREEDVKRAEDMVRSILFDKAHASSLKRRQLANLGNGPGATIDDPNISTRDIKVPREIIGSVIGRGGENMRDIKDKSGANLQVKDPLDNNDSDRTIHIRGAKECVERAEDLLNRLIREKEQIHREKFSRQSSFSSSDRQEFKIDIPENTVGLVIGKGGQTIKSIQSRNNVRIDVPHVPDPRNPSIRTISVFASSKEDFDRANEEIQRAIAPTDGPSGGAGGGGMGGGGSGYQSYGQDSRSNMEVYVVPQDKIGIVIGKGGSTIKMIQSRSQCGVQVQPAEAGNSMRNIHLTGTPEQCQRAREEIDNAISSYYQGRSGGGYGSGGGGGSMGAGAPYGADYGGGQYQANNYSAQWQQQPQQQQYYQQQPQQPQGWASQQSMGYQTQESAAPAQQQGATSMSSSNAATGLQAGGQKYTREQWKAWKAYYDQFPQSRGTMPDSPPPELLLDSERSS